MILIQDITEKLLHKGFRYHKLGKIFTIFPTDLRKSFSNTDVLVDDSNMQVYPTIHFMVKFLTREA